MDRLHEEDFSLSLTDGVYFLCDQECLSSHSGCCRRRLGPCVTPTHNNDIILLSGKVTGTSGNQHQETLQAREPLCQHVRCTPVEGELHDQKCGRDDFFFLLMGAEQSDGKAALILILKLNRTTLG